MERVTNYREAIERIRTDASYVDAVVLKAAHGGPRYRGTFVVDQDVIAAMRQFTPAAAVHNTIYLAVIEALQQAMPGVPIVASFEPEFHATRPDYTRLYGVPNEWLKDGVMKYGFHGASHEFIAGRMAQLVGRQARLVSCHLGGSSSVCAISGGRSVDTTMGFSPQSGLENATRPGDVDIFAVLYMMERHGWGVHDIQRQLAKGGGLAGISGIEGGDVRDLEVAAAKGNQRAALALEIFAYEVKKSIGAFAATLGGLDAISFTGGIGENSARLRAACCQGLEFLGIRLDPAKNESGEGDRPVSADDSRVSVWVIGTNEELMIARRAFRLLSSAEEPRDLHREFVKSRSTT
jgi:acetate kinase